MHMRGLRLPRCRWPLDYISLIITLKMNGCFRRIQLWSFGLKFKIRNYVYLHDVIFISLWKPFAINNLLSEGLTTWLIIRSLSRMMIWRDKRVLRSCGSADRATFRTPYSFVKKNSLDKSSFSSIKEEYLTREICFNFPWRPTYIVATFPLLVQGYVMSLAVSSHPHRVITIEQ